MGFVLSIGQGGTPPHLLEYFPAATCSVAGTYWVPLATFSCGWDNCFQTQPSVVMITSADVVPQDFSPVCRLDGTNPVQAIRKLVSLVETIPQGAFVRVLHSSFMKYCGGGVEAGNGTQIPLFLKYDVS